MDFVKANIPDVVIIQPKVIKDERGHFSETFRQDKFYDFIGYKVNFCQDNETKSNKGVLRGLHFQLPPFVQSKLVRVIQGEVLDIAVDIREGSPTFGQYVREILSDKNMKQLFIPRGFAHGFLVMSEWAIFSYKVDNFYSYKHDAGLAYNDPALNIDWRIQNDQLILSKKDLKLPHLCNLKKECYELKYEKKLYE